MSKLPSYYSNLKALSVKKSRQKYNSSTGQYEDDDSLPPVISEEEKNKIVIDYFLKAGLDYKGQFQCCYETKGGGLQVDASIDPGRIFFPIVSTEITLGGSLTKSQGLFLVAQRGPSLEVKSSKYCFKTPLPIVINCFSGGSWEGSVKAGIEVGIGVEASAKTLSIDTKDGVNSSREAEAKGSWEDDDDETPPALSMESFAVGCEATAKVGVKAEAGYTYQHYYAEDLCPVPFKAEDGSSFAAAKQQLIQIFDAGSYKYFVKQKVCDFINKHPGSFKAVKYHDPHWYRAGKGFITSKKICEIVAKGITKKQKRNISDAVVAEAQSLRASLLCWADSTERPTVTTSIAISAHEGSAEAGVFATATASASACGLVSASVEASATCNIKGSYKRSTVRYQTVYPVIDEGVNIVMTQSSSIVYKQITFTPSIGVSAEATGLGYSTNDIKKVEDTMEKLTLTKDFKLLNRMTYTTSTIYWPCRKTFSDQTSSTKKMIYACSSEASTGTGVSFGGSFQVKTLQSFYDFYVSDTDTFSKPNIETYFNTVAKSIGVELTDLKKFFKGLLNQGGKLFLEELIQANGVETVLLEASFRTSISEVKVNQIVKGKEEMFELDQSTSKNLLKAYKKNGILEAIRMRYRIQDAFNGDKDLFTLGIKIAGTGLGITLKKVDRAGSEGIMDLATIWMDPSLASLSGKTAYEKAVPPVALFCQ